jgi:HlyD family secretion protein
MTFDHVDQDRAIEARAATAASEPPPRPADPRSAPRKRLVGLATKLVALAVVLAAAAWAWYANVSARPTMDMSSMRVTAGATPFPVALAPVERGPMAGTVVYTGSVAPLNEEDIYPRVTGRILEIPVYPGDAVRPGQIVARLDDVELGSRVREAESGAMAAAATAAQMEADVTAARHEIVQMERELTMSTQELRAARDNVAQMESEVTMVSADAEHQGHLIVRDERLYASGGISLQDLEATRAAVTAAQAKVSAARARVSQMKAMVSAAEAKVDAARARLERAKAMEQSTERRREAMTAMAAQSQAMQRTAEVVRDYVNIRTRSGGYVVKRLVAPGVLVQPGMAILKVAQIDRVRLQANVGEKDLASITVGSPVKVTPAGTGQAPISARVTSVFPFVDQGARTGVVEAIVDNAARRLLPGQYVQLEFVTGNRPHALTVPRAAVVRMGGKARVWEVQGDRAQPHEVTTGLESPDRIEIVSGLSETAQVIARGHEGLYAGARVTDVTGNAAGGANPHAGHAGMESEGSAPAATHDHGAAVHGPDQAVPAPEQPDSRAGNGTSSASTTAASNESAPSKGGSHGSHSGH